MKIKTISLLIMSTLQFMSASAQTTVTADYQVIPLPESIAKAVLRGGGPLPGAAVAKPMEKA